jgi:hypothetical protein
MKETLMALKMASLKKVALLVLVSVSKAWAAL